MILKAKQINKEKTVANETELQQPLPARIHREHHEHRKQVILTSSLSSAMNQQQNQQYYYPLRPSYQPNSSSYFHLSVQQLLFILRRLFLLQYLRNFSSYW